MVSGHRRRGRVAVLRACVIGLAATAVVAATAGQAVASPSGLALTGTAATSTTATAVPPAAAAGAAPAAPLTVAAAEAQADAAYRRAEIAVEALDAATARSRSTTADLAAARAAVAAQQRAVDTLQVTLGTQAAATYRSGGLGVSARILLAGNADTFIDSLTTVRALRAQQTRQLGTLQGGVVQLRAGQDRLAAAQAAAAAVTAERTATKAALDRAAADAEAVLNRLDAGQRAQMAAQLATATVADRAEASTLLARVDAGSGTAPVPGYDNPAPGGSAADGSNSRSADTGGADDSVPLIPQIAPIPQSAPIPDPGAAVPAVDDARVARVLAYAAAQLGHPYVWGATGPTAFDCSGLTVRAWQQAGVTLPRTSAVQFATGRRVDRNDLRPGDLVFFYSPVSHVGIYIGGGKMINASNPRTGVKISNVFGPAYAGAVRPV